MTRAALVGLGTMGPGIAATLARGGMTVACYDTSAQSRDNAPAMIAVAGDVLERLAMPDRSNGAAVEICDTMDACVDGADLVIENVPENLEIKAGVFAQLDRLVGSGCILASDTSGIPITKLQEGNSAPGRVVGMHWSNPPHIIPIVEVIAGAKTSQATVAWMVSTIEDLGLKPVVVKKDVPGFVENRVLYALMRECVDLVDQGVIDAESLDTCVSWGIGYKLAVIGPMALLDVAGLDIYQAVGGYLNADLSKRGDVSAYVTDKTAQGHLGMKTGGGIYDYTPARIAELRAERAAKLVAVRGALES
jgi:3-hydroxybutyryl-CoA dehydrogenase/5-formyl-3-hydroxy-2-methylpyridine 4-carboxylate dehydrogenase